MSKTATRQLPESTNIKHFIKMLGEKNYSNADKYLKKIIEDKLQSKISKQYQKLWVEQYLVNYSSNTCFAVGHWIVSQPTGSLAVLLEN